VLTPRTFTPEAYVGKPSSTSLLHSTYKSSHFTYTCIIYQSIAFHTIQYLCIAQLSAYRSYAPDIPHENRVSPSAKSQSTLKSSSRVRGRNKTKQNKNASRKCREKIYWHGLQVLSKKLFERRTLEGEHLQHPRTIRCSFIY
jgi:hypothetical protein